MQDTWQSVRKLLLGIARAKREKNGRRHEQSSHRSRQKEEKASTARQAKSRPKLRPIKGEPNNNQRRWLLTFCLKVEAWRLGGRIRSPPNIARYSWENTERAHASERRRQNTSGKTRKKTKVKEKGRGDVWCTSTPR